MTVDVVERAEKAAAELLAEEAREQEAMKWREQVKQRKQARASAEKLKQELKPLEISPALPAIPVKEPTPSSGQVPHSSASLQTADL